MKRNDFMQIKGLGVKELIQKADGFKKELADLIMDKNMKKLKDLRVISKKRKDLAQVLTILRQKEQLSILSDQLSEGTKPAISSSVKKPEAEKQKTANRKKKGAK